MIKSRVGSAAGAPARPRDWVVGWASPPAPATTVSAPARHTDLGLRTVFLMLIKAYLDESNSNLQGKVCVVAGYLGYEDQWTGFMRDWEQMLGNRKLHMKNLRWKAPERDLL